MGRWGATTGGPRQALLLLLLAVTPPLATAACGSSPTRPTPSPPAAQTLPATATVPTTVAATPSAATPRPRDAGGTPTVRTTVQVDSLPTVRLAIAALAGELQLPPEQITVLRATPTEWPNSSLGCPEPGQVYLDVITPGYVIVLAAQGRPGTYEYHSDSARRVVRCRQPAGTPAIRAAPTTNSPTAVRLAVDALAHDLQLRPEEIQVVLVEDRDWPDSSLGCPEPGRAYLQVITPGHRVILAAGGRQYRYHTDGRDLAIRCPE